MLRIERGIANLTGHCIGDAGNMLQAMGACVRVVGPDVGDIDKVRLPEAMRSKHLVGLVPAVFGEQNAIRLPGDVASALQ